jgi:hypothetical protein
MSSELQPAAEAPTTPPAAGTAPPRATPDWMSGRAISSALVVAGVALVVALVVSTIATVMLPLALVGADLSIGGQSIDTSQLSSSAPTSSTSPFALVLLIAALSLLGQVGVHSSGGGALIDGAIVVTPLLLTIVIALATSWGAYGAQKLHRASSKLGMVVLSAMSAVVVAILITVLTLLLPLSGSADGLDASLSAGNARTFFGALVLVFGASMFGRWAGRGEQSLRLAAFPRAAAARVAGAPVLVRDVVTVAAIGSVTFGVIGVIGGLVVVGTQYGWGPAAAGLLLYAGPAAENTAALGQFGSVWILSSGLGTSHSSFASVSTSTPLAWLLVLAALLVVALAALRISRRRAWSTRTQLASAWRFPVVLALLWFVLPWLVIVQVAGSGTIPILGAGTLSLFVGIAPWFFLIAALWGAAIEALARFVAPRLVASYPLAARLAGSPVGGGPVDASPALDARGRRGWAIGGIVSAAVIFVLVIGGIAVSVLSTTVFGPGAVLAGYVSTIQKGDVAAATTQVPPSKPTTALLTGDPLSKSADRISGVTTKITSTSGDTAVGSVSFSVAGHREKVQLQLTRSGTQFGIFPIWHVTTPLTTEVQISASHATTASLNGVSVPLVDGYATVTVYPGRYEATIPSSNKWFSANPVTVVPGTNGGAATLKVMPTEALLTEVTSQIRAVIDTCVAAGAPQAAGCPFEEYTFGTVSGFTWHVDTYPTISIDSDGTTFELNGGQVTADYTEDYFGFTQHQTDPQDIYGYGSLTFSDSKVTATLR